MITTLVNGKSISYNHNGSDCDLVNCFSVELHESVTSLKAAWKNVRVVITYGRMPRRHACRKIEIKSG